MIIAGRRVAKGEAEGPSLSETKRVDGWLWPRSDERCAQFVWKRLPDLDQALTFCDRFDVAVQAGGNCGVWPDALAKKFGAVYTFEADPLNFRCLAANVPAEHVFKFNAALGYERGCVDLVRTLNCGAHRVGGPGRIPRLRIDDLALDTCDFLQLDIEGYEYPAFLGAMETIEKHHPLVMYEAKGKAKQYGVRGEDIPEFLTARGYKLVLQVNADWVWKWRSTD
jgi:FkbM family methyltransferase